MRYNASVGESRELEVPFEAAGSRLDVFLAQALAEPSRSFIKRLVDADLVELEDAKSKPSAKVRAGQRVRVFLPELQELSAEPEAIPLTVLFEDRHLIVIDKPPGIVVHPSPGHESGTLVNALLYHCRDLSGIGGALRPGIVHRLDRDTSGCLVCAKSDAAHRELSAQFAARTLGKTYLAITHGVPRPPEGKVEARIGRHPKRRQRQALLEKGGRHSLTFYRTMEEFGDRFALVECDIKTGRTHQIRVHLKSVRAPILCDAEYGRQKTIGSGELLGRAVQGSDAPVLARQALHAWRLAFTHPASEERMHFEAPLPVDLSAVLDVLRRATR